MAHLGKGLTCRHDRPCLKKIKLRGGGGDLAGKGLATKPKEGIDSHMLSSDLYMHNPPPHTHTIKDQAESHQGNA